MRRPPWPQGGRSSSHCPRGTGLASRSRPHRWVWPGTSDPSRSWVGARGPQRWPVCTFPGGSVCATGRLVLGRSVPTQPSGWPSLRGERPGPTTRPRREAGASVQRGWRGRRGAHPPSAPRSCMSVTGARTKPARPAAPSPCTSEDRARWSRQLPGSRLPPGSVARPPAGAHSSAPGRSLCRAGGPLPLREQQAPCSLWGWRPSVCLFHALVCPDSWGRRGQVAGFLPHETSG